MTAKRSWTRVLALGAGTWMAAFAGCSGDSGNGDGDISIRDFPRQFAIAMCDNLGPCCQQEGFAYDAATCRAKMERALTVEASQGNLPFDPKSARACIDAVASLARTCAADDVEATWNATCGHVYSGHQPEGAYCTTGFQCASGECVRPGDGTAWHCTGPRGPVRGQVGQSCSTTCSRNPKSATISCVVVDPAAPMNGVPCFSDEELVCDTKTFLCTARPEAGEPCGSLGCRHGAFCENGVCALQRVDGPCDGTIDACAPTSYCGSSTPRQCVPRKARGEACGSDDQCAKGDDCNMTCRGRTLASKENCM